MIFVSQKISDLIWEKIQKGLFIIAEIGKNFIQTKEERSPEIYLKNACELVDRAVEAGVDAVKFQTHNVEDEQMNLEIVSPHFKGSDRYNWVRRNTLATPLVEFWLPLKEYCERRGIVFFSTPMSRGAAKILDQVGVPLWKVGSGDILDFVLLDYLRQKGQPVILSSGMSTLEEVERALKYVREKNNRVVLLHCVSKYPCPPEDLNLATIGFYKKRFDMSIGFSDHSIEIEPSLAAVAMGATVIEKHFSLSRDLWGSDHKVSLTPEELTILVKKCKDIQSHPEKRQEVLQGEYAVKSLGISGKNLQEEEAVFRPVFRKSLVAARDIARGVSITPELVYAMRPQQFIAGLPSEDYEHLLGKRALADIKKYQPLELNMVE